MPTLNTVIKQASRGADLYFVFRFLRLLTMKYEKTAAYKLGIIDKKGKPLKRSSELESVDEKLTFQARIVEESFVGVVSSTALFGSLITQLDASEDPDPMGNVPTLITKAVRVSKQGS